MNGHAVGEDRNRKRLEVFGHAETAAIEKSHRLRGAVQHLRSAWRNAEGELLVFARAGDDFERIAHQRIIDFHLQDSLLHIEHVCTGQNWLQIFELGSTSFSAQNLTLGIAVRITHLYAHQKSIQLRFRQRIRPVMLNGVLCSDHQKRLRQRMANRIDCDLAFVHGFEQRRLSLRRSAINFVCEQNVGEYRPALELELLLRRRIDRNTNNVRRQHIAGELHALKAASEQASESMGQSRFAHSRNAFD